jgi:MFS family permease
LVLTAIPSLGKTGSGVSQTLIGFLRSIPSTFRYVGQAQNVGNILARNALFSFFVVAIPALAPVLLLKELRLDASSLGLVFASMGVGSVISAIFVIPWLRSRLATDALMIIAQVTLAGVYILMAMVHHCLYCLVPMALAGASWTLAASELWVIAQRSIPNSLRGRISALMMVLSQGAMTLGGVVWGVVAELTGTRVTLLAAAFLFLTTVLGSMLFSKIFESQLLFKVKRDHLQHRAGSACNQGRLRCWLTLSSRRGSEHLSSTIKPQ